MTFTTITVQLLFSREEIMLPQFGSCTKGIAQMIKYVNPTNNALQLKFHIFTLFLYNNERKSFVNLANCFGSMVCCLHNTLTNDQKLMAHGWLLCKRRLLPLFAGTAHILRLPDLDAVCYLWTCGDFTKRTFVWIRLKLFLSTSAAAGSFNS